MYQSGLSMTPCGPAHFGDAAEDSEGNSKRDLATSHYSPPRQRLINKLFHDAGYEPGRVAALSWDI